MSLERFVFISNGYIRHKRIEKRGAIYNQVKQGGKMKSRVESKVKYLRRLVMYNSKMEERNPDKTAAAVHEEKPRNELEGARTMQCDPRWPLCLYDHTCKNRCSSYFVYRCASPPAFIDDYFESLSLVVPACVKKSSDPLPNDWSRIELLVKESGLGSSLGVLSDQLALNEEGGGEEIVLQGECDGIKDLEELPAHKPQEQEPELNERVYGALLVERDVHYCTNKEFVEKVIHLLSEQKGSAAFEDSRVDAGVNSEMSLLNAMEEYVGQILDYSEEAKSPQHGVRKTEEDVHSASAEEAGTNGEANVTVDLGEMRRRWDFWRGKPEALTAYLRAVTLKMPYR